MSRLGRYELHRVLGEGGMGTVWEATLHGPAGFAKQVALKVLKQGGDGLIKEARLGGLLRHPHLVEVYALEQVDDTWVCAMELVSGGSLAGKTLPPRAVVDVGIQIAQGLAHAHEHVGLVHLDLKPANLLLDHGRVKVADLGISRAHGFEGDGEIRGTPAYMAPEHRLGEAVDARADIYALGVVLVALATGEPSRHPDAVPWLRTVLTRCLPLEPEARFTSMREVEQALRQLAIAGPGLAEWAHPDLQSGTDPMAEPTDHGGGATPAEVYRAFTNLGPEPDAFVGRGTDVLALLEALGEPGLITIKGAGGLGKTRLARRVARQWHDRTRQPAWFVDLSSAESADEVVQAVAGVLDVPLGRGRDDTAAQTVGWALDGRGPILCVLDNFEQIAAHAALVQQWRQLAPQARFLVTSREPLKLRGERVHELGPLSEGDARALLLTRAGPRAAVLRDDPALPELIRQLDQLPLALELAASRLAVLAPAKMLERLDRRFALLKKRDPTLSRREATLEGTLDWSWDLLSEAERTVLAQASAFVDGIGIEAAEEVLDLDDDWAVDVLQSLLDRSLLFTRDDGRLGMLVSVRAYAARRDPQAVEAASARHLAHFAALGTEEAVEALWQADGIALRQERLPDLGNVLAAARRAIDIDSPHTADLIAAAWSLLRLQGPFATAAALAERALAHTRLGDRDRARVLTCLGGALQRMGDGDAAERALTEALAHFQATGDADGQARIHRWVGVLHREHGALDEAHRSLARGLSALDGPTRMRAVLLGELAVVHHRRGALDEAQVCFEEALSGLRQAGDRATEARVLGNYANLHLDAGRVAEAEACYKRAMRRHHEAGSRASEAVVRTNLAGLRFEQGRLDEARSLYEQALATHREVGHKGAVAHVLGDMGVLYVQLGAPEHAEEAYRDALEQERDLGDATGVAHTLYNLGGLLGRAGRRDEAQAALNAALEGFRDTSDRASAACTLGTLGVIARDAGDRDEARTLLDEAIAEVRAAQLKRAEGAFLGERAWLRAQEGDAAGAREDSRAGEAILRELGDPIQLGLLLCNRVAAERKLGDAEAAHAALREVQDIALPMELAPLNPLMQALERARAVTLA